MTDWEAKHKAMRAEADEKWGAVYKAEGIAALKKFEAAARKFQRLLAKVAAGELDDEAAWKPFERLQTMASTPELRNHDPSWQTADAWIGRLRAESLAARAAGTVARSEARDREMRKLNERVHDERAERDRNNPYGREMAAAALSHASLLQRMRSGKS